MFSSTEIRNAVLGCVDTSVDDDSENKSSTRHTAPAWTRLTSQAVPPAAEDVAELAGYTFLLAVVPRPRSTSASSSFTAISEWLTELFSPKPTKIHVALLSLIGSESRCCPFSTYGGIGAGWDSQFSHQDMVAYYLQGPYSGCWRAFPIATTKTEASTFAKNCKACESAPYSLSRYVCSVPPFRNLTRFLNDDCKAPAHCAGLAARILSRTFGFLKHAPPYYHPTSLYEECRDVSLAMRLAARVKGDADVIATELDKVENTLLFGTLSSVAGVDATEASKVFSQASSSLLKARAGGQETDALEAALATMLLRWVTAAVPPQRRK